MKKSDQIVLIYAHADLCGALEEHIHNNNKESIHDWNGLRDTISEMEERYGFLEKTDPENLIHE